MIDRFRPNWKTWERLASRRLLDHSIRHNGLQRTALLYVPRHMQDRGELPLVLVFHGGSSDPNTIARTSAMHRIAEREGFIVAYPTGTQGGSGLTWKPSSKASTGKTEDARFVRKLICDLERAYAIDPARIFAAGFSIGGSLVYDLAALLADQIAAVAVVSGVMTSATHTPTRPVPLIHIHGTKDRRVPLQGGRGPATSASNEWPPVQAGIDRWCEINGCTSEPQVVRLGLEGVTGYRHSGAADVELWLVEDGYHTWPGSLRDDASPAESLAETSGFSASEKIWSFFAAHPRLGRFLSHTGPARGIRPRLMRRRV